MTNGTTAPEESAADDAATATSNAADTSSAEAKTPTETGDAANETATEENGANAEDDSAKKPKKDKVKKRWSFRSFSFSKKDKQKPAKKDDAAAAAAATANGECEKVPEEVSVFVCERCCSTYLGMKGIGEPFDGFL